MSAIKNFRTTLHQDLRIARKSGDERGQLYRHLNDFYSEMYILVPKYFKDGDRVRVTVELLGRRKRNGEGK